MKDESFSFGDLRVDKQWLFFPSGASIKLSEITNMDILWYPKRKIIRGILIWFVLIYLFEFFDMTSGIMFFVGIVIVFGGPMLLWDSLKYNANEAITALRVQVSSGYSVFLHSKDYQFLVDLRDKIWEAAQSKRDVWTMTLNNYGQVNFADRIHIHEDKGKDK